MTQNFAELFRKAKSGDAAARKALLGWIRSKKTMSLDIAAAITSLPGLMAEGSLSSEQAARSLVEGVGRQKGIRDLLVARYDDMPYFADMQPEPVSH